MKALKFQQSSTYLLFALKSFIHSKYLSIFYPFFFLLFELLIVESKFRGFILVPNVTNWDELV